MGTKFKHSLLLLMIWLGTMTTWAQGTLISGKVLSADKSEIDFATVYLKGTNYGCTTNEKGIYHLKAPAGKYTLIVSAIGYETAEKQVALTDGERLKQNIVLKPSVTELDEVVVVSTGVSRVKRSAFNAVAVDTKEMQNSTKSLSEALTKAPGMKLRESGGVGSDMQLMMDGFSGKHVKVFIDGVPGRIRNRRYRRSHQHRDQQETTQLVPGCFLLVRLVQHPQVIHQLRTDVQKRFHLRNQCFPELLGQRLLRGCSGTGFRYREPERDLPTGETVQ